MATLNLSMPEELKQRFLATFPNENKSALLARLIEQAINDAENKRRRQASIRTLIRNLDTRPQVSSERLHAAREDGRP